MPFNPASKKSVGSTMKNGLGSMLGFTEKAILEVGDTSEVSVQLNDAQKADSGGIGSLKGLGNFNKMAVASFVNAGTGNLDQGFELHGQMNRYIFEVQFNPEELYINGYGGEELPIQNYRTKDQDQDKKNRGSHMAAANTRIDFNVKLVFDRSNPQDAFYADKFTLGQTSIAKGGMRAAGKAMGKIRNTVQPEVEALTSIVRSEKKRMCRFIWGDMVYEGILNTVSAEYVMFNVNGEPCRAFVQIGMVLYDKDVHGADTNIWQKEYIEDFQSLKNPALAFKPNFL